MKIRDLFFFIIGNKMGSILIKSNMYSYVIFGSFSLRPQEEKLLEVDNLVLSEFKSLKNLVDTNKIIVNEVAYSLITSKISELSPSTGGGGVSIDTFTKDEIISLLATKLNISDESSIATELTPGRTITLGGSIVSNSVLFDGKENIVLNVSDIDGSKISSGTISSARIPTLNQNTTGNAGTATKLATARTIGGVSFDGSANINLPGVNAVGTQATTGNAATATKLATARTINGVSFDGSANITVADNTKLPLTGGTVSNLLLNTPLVITSGGTGASSLEQAKINLGITPATTTLAGLLSSADKVKLDSLSQITIRKLTQSEYDVLSSTEKMAVNILYVITE